MALTTKVIDGDLLTLRIVFPDDRTVTVTAGRDGKSVGVAPNDGKIADRLSSIFHWSTEKVGRTRLSVHQPQPGHLWDGDAGPVRDERGTVHRRAAGGAGGVRNVL